MASFVLEQIRGTHLTLPDRYNLAATLRLVPPRFDSELPFVGNEHKLGSY
jgi:hypothetical protein